MDYETKKTLWRTSAKKHFERMSVDNSELREAIPELLKVLDDLHDRRESEYKTERYINEWRKTKYKQYLLRPNKDGVLCEVYNNNPDMFTHDKFINWLVYFLKEIYDIWNGKGFDFVFALRDLAQYHNLQILNDRLRGEMIDLPNTEFDANMELVELANELQGKPDASSIPSKYIKTIEDYAEEENAKKQAELELATTPSDDNNTSNCKPEEIGDQQSEFNGFVETAFTSRLKHNNKSALVDVLRKLLEGKRGKDVAKIIMALEDEGFLIIPTRELTNIIKEMVLDFGDIGSVTGIRDCYRKKDAKGNLLIPQSDIDDITKRFP